MISIIIPVFNNQSTLIKLAEDIFKSLDNTPEEKLEVIFINDGSRDNSGLVLNELATKYPKIKVIHLARNFGQHPAISAGFENASGNIIILMDADLEDDPKNIPQLISSIRSGNDICFTIRDEPPQWNLVRLLSKLYHILVDLILKEKNPKNLGTFRAFNKKVLLALLSHPERLILYGPLMHHMGFKREFIKVQRHSNPRVSSYTLAKRIQLALSSIISYSDLPHKVFFWTGTFIFLMSSGYALLSFLQYLLLGKHGTHKSQ